MTWSRLVFHRNLYATTIVERQVHCLRPSQVNSDVLSICPMMLRNILGLFIDIMKKLLYILVVSLCFIPVQAVEIEWQVEISKENVVGVFQDTSKTRPTYYMVLYYNGKRVMASMTKSEVQKYSIVTKLDVDYHVILQQLKTKKRVIIEV